MLHADMVSCWSEIGDRVFVQRHASYDLNVGLVVGDETCAVIDTRATLREGTDLAEAVRQVTSIPWLVVNTHAHFDHFLGNGAFAPAPIWSSTRCAQVIAATGDAQRAAVARSLRADGNAREADDTDATPVLAPTCRFGGRTHALELGGRELAMTVLGRGHTDNDLVVTIAGTPVIFAGDLVEEGAPPSFEDSYPLEWPDTVAAMLALGGVQTFVPGHGGVTDRDFVRAQQTVLVQVVSAARELAAGPVPDDAWRLTGVPEPAGRIALTRCLAQLRGELR
jgi:glyoxylase-like metal-dependent hydrolase (beta-lactamase superfamily II)